MGSPQDDIYMLAARLRLGCQSTMVGTGRRNSCPGCMDRLRKCYSHPVGGGGGREGTESADHCMVVH